MKTTKGFTLVELLVVIAILAILATVSVVGYTSYINSTNDAAAHSELAQIKTYMANYDLVSGNKDGIVSAEEVNAAINSSTGDAEMLKYAAYINVDATNKVVKYSKNSGNAYWNLTTGEVVKGAYTAPSAPATSTTAPSEPDPA